MPTDTATDTAIKWAERVLAPLHRYHRFAVEGLEHIPSSGGVLLAVSHSMATYDGFLLGLEIHRQRGRLMAALGDDLLFKIPGTRQMSQALGIFPASPNAGLKLLSDGHLLGVAPGGMQEALRSYNSRYQVKWRQRRGFIRLAIRAQVPIVLSACPAADDLYDVYPSALTDQLYQRFRLPLPILRGLGPTLLPRPIQLTHHLSEPIAPPKYDAAGVEHPDSALEKLVDKHHAAVLQRMERLISEARQG